MPARPCDQVNAVSPRPLTWSCSFPAIPSQVPEARHFLAELLDGSPLADDALLCLSELVTNAIQHSRSARPGGQFGVSATIGHGSLRIEVHDEGGAWEPGSTADGLRGRGLAIVAALAHWGITSNEDGSRAVWFDLPHMHAGSAHG